MAITLRNKQFCFAQETIESNEKQFFLNGKNKLFGLVVEHVIYIYIFIYE